MLKFGKINAVDLDLLRVRVTFDDDGVTSHWLPVMVQGSQGTKYFHSFAINTHVVCSMDERAENGVCMGAIYDKNNPPNIGGENIVEIAFDDGSTVVYDSANSEMVVTVGQTVIKSSQLGVEITRGGESLNLILNDILTQIQAMTVTCSAPGSPSSPPINLAAFAAIAARLPNLFTA